MKTVDRLVILGFRPLRQYFSYIGSSPREEGERNEKIPTREKMSKQLPPAPTASALGPWPTIIQISGTPCQNEHGK